MGHEANEGSDAASIVASNLEAFVRLAHRGLTDDALNWYNTHLKQHEQQPQVLVEYTDMLLQEELYEQLVQALDGVDLHSLPAEESRLSDSMRDLAIIRGNGMAGAETLEKAARCRDYLKEVHSAGFNEGHQINPMFARTVRVYLGIVVATWDAGHLTEEDDTQHTNLPWTAPGSSHWSGFLAWYTELQADLNHPWEAHQLLRLLLPVVPSTHAFSTLIRRDQFLPITAQIKSHTASETALLAALSTSNTITTHLLASSHPPPILHTKIYLSASRNLRSVLLQSDTTLSLARPVLRVDELTDAIRQAVHTNLAQHAFDTDTVETLLLNSATEGDETAVRLVLEHYKGEVGPGHEDQQWRTALSHAAEGGHEGVVGLLLGTKGVDVGGRDFAGRSALSYAAGEGHAMVVEMLLGKGARREERDGEGKTALERAVEGGFGGVVELLGGGRG